MWGIKELYVVPEHQVADPNPYKQITRYILFFDTLFNIWYKTIKLNKQKAGNSSRFDLLLIIPR